MRTLSLPLAFGAIGLGIVGLFFGDFALQWQPVPAGIGGRAALATVSASISIALGIAALVPRWRAIGGLGLAIQYALWVIVLHGPRVAAAPASLVTWLGVAEIAALVAGGLMIDAVAAPPGRFPAQMTVARMILGLSALVFGLSHFLYLDFTAAMVPKMFPMPLVWASATGAGHCLAGLAILTGILVRPAATALAGMCAAFTLFLHLPRVIATPASHAEWTMLFIAVSIAGAAWTMRWADAR